MRQSNSDCGLWNECRTTELCSLSAIILLITSAEGDYLKDAMVILALLLILAMTYLALRLAIPIQRLLGVNGDLGQMLNIDNKWAYNAIKQLGNYGELFERNLGQETPMQLSRGVNALWTQGGILYAPPMP